MLTFDVATDRSRAYANAQTATFFFFFAQSQEDSPSLRPPVLCVLCLGTQSTAFQHIAVHEEHGGDTACRQCDGLWSFQKAYGVRVVLEATEALKHFRKFGGLRLSGRHACAPPELSSQAWNVRWTGGLARLVFLFWLQKILWAPPCSLYRMAGLRYQNEWLGFLQSLSAWLKRVLVSCCPPAWGRVHVVVGVLAPLCLILVVLGDGPHSIPLSSVNVHR